MVDVEPGCLLVATPLTRDPNFHRTVVLVLEHSDEGSLGVILNRPTDVAVAETLPKWADAMAPPAVLFFGGPVEPRVAICLGHHQDAGAGAGEGRASWEHMVTVDLEADPTEIEAQFDGLRLFSGYAGWAPGQLDGEIDAGGWFVLAAAEGDAFTADVETLWHDVLERQPGSLAWVANFPVDPSMN